MSLSLAIYIPLFNGAEWCRTVELPAGAAVIASDNGCTDGAAEVLENRGAAVVRQPRSLGRVGNWAFCLNHFRASEAEWMKFLFVGDRVVSDFASDLSRAAAAHPEAKLFIFGFTNEFASGPELFLPAAQESTIASAEALRRVVMEGSWFGGFIALAIHRSLLVEPVAVPPFDWAADLYMIVELLRRTEAVVIPRSIATFVAKERRHFGKLHGSLQAALEDGWLRDYVLRLLEAAGEPGTEKLRQTLYRDTARMVLSAENNGCGGSRHGALNQPGEMLAQLIGWQALRREAVRRIVRKARRLLGGS